MIRLWTLRVCGFEVLAVQIDHDDEPEAEDDPPQFGFGGASGGSHTLADEYHDARFDEVT